MRPVRIPSAEVRAGLVLARDLRDSNGSVVLPKGRLLTDSDAAKLRDGGPVDVHALAVEPGDLHEEPAGRRLAAAAAGEGVEAQAPLGGTYALVARTNGIVEVDAARLARVNGVDDVVVATLPHGQIVAAGEPVARAKIVPFVTREERVARAEELARPGLVRVRPFVPSRVAAVVEERIAAAALQQFRAQFDEKLRFFGSTLADVATADGSAAGFAGALRRLLDAGAQIVLVAGGRAMDPQDPALEGLLRAGGTLLRQGMPAHPGALLWLGIVDGATVVGVPSCGIAARATALDLLLPRLFAGDRPSRELLAELGAGGMITPVNSHRLPPYRPSGARGEVD